MGPPVAAGLAAKASTSPIAKSARIATSATRSVVHHHSEKVPGLARLMTPPSAQNARALPRSLEIVRPDLHNPGTGRMKSKPAKGERPAKAHPSEPHRKRQPSRHSREYRYARMAPAREAYLQIQRRLRRSDKLCVRAMHR